MKADLKEKWSEAPPFLKYDTEAVIQDYEVYSWCEYSCG